jgi:hypothetical protein
VCVCLRRRNRHALRQCVCVRFRPRVLQSLLVPPEAG